LEVNPKEPIDVCIVSNRKIEDELLAMLHASVPVKNLIIDSKTSPLGKAREKAISEVSTQRFMFLDDDVYIPPNYYTDLMKYWGEKTGWLEGWAIPWKPEWYHEWTVSRFNHSSVIKIPYNGRGFCCASVIKTDTLSDWRSPPDLHFYEDLVMSNHVIQKGYEVVRVPVACEHRIPYDIWKHVESGIQQNKKVRGLSKTQLIKYALTYWLSGMKASVDMRNPSIASNSIKYALKFLEA
jgi:glycosyltransferase involved in cell wall biosynthesis